ncbi:hypothetical protein [Streptomyces sp. KR80]
MPAIAIPLIAGYAFIRLPRPLHQDSGRIGIALLRLGLVTPFRSDPRTLP